MVFIETCTQNLVTELPEDSPSLTFNVEVEVGAYLITRAVVYITNTTLTLAGSVDTMQDLIIGPQGKVVVMLEHYSICLLYV